MIFLFEDIFFVLDNVVADAIIDDYGPISGYWFGIPSDIR